MRELPADWQALCVLVFLLGMRHGFDADHLATIDGLTRLNQRLRPLLARCCGALFALGHGSVVMAIALAVGSASQRWAPPAWLDVVGAWVSVMFLLVLGMANLSAVLSTAPGQPMPLVGLKARLLGPLRQARNPWAVASVGALFALSFDTMSQAALFAATALPFGGVGRAASLGGLFVAGMLFTDGLNGWWIARLLARADDLAALASRVMGAAVAGASLLVGALGLARLLSERFERWAEGTSWVVASVVIGIVVLGYLVAHALARRTGRRPSVA